MNLGRIFGLPEPGTQAWVETDTVRKIVDALERMNPEKAAYIAAFAFMLGRVAYSDQSVSDDEFQLMESIVMEVGELPAEQATLIAQMARQRAHLFGATENFLVSREFNRLTDRDQKLNLLQCLFAVSAAENDISGTEEQEIRQIANELELDYRDFISARAAFRDRQASLKQTADAGR